jgi:hypothetical protein
VAAGSGEVDAAGRPTMQALRRVTPAGAEAAGRFDVHGRSPRRARLARGYDRDVIYRS